LIDVVTATFFYSSISFPLLSISSSSKKSWLSLSDTGESFPFRVGDGLLTHASDPYYSDCNYSTWDSWGRWVAFAVIVGCAFLVFFFFA
jgi:hypothetical protein